MLEYLGDIPAALAEFHRVLKPGGVVTIGDWHWDTPVWQSDNPERTRAMIAGWDGHLVERCVPAILPDLMRRNGFSVQSVEPVTFADTTLRPDGIANMMLHLMYAYAMEHGFLGKEDAKGWVDQQWAVAAEGRFFVSITHCVITARKA